MRERFHNIEVAQFEVSPGVNFPAQRLMPLRGEIVKQLQESKKAGDVFRMGEPNLHPDEPLLKLSGTVLKFDPGNQAERYFVGFGAGSTEFYAHIVLADAVSGRVFVTEDIRATVQGGLEPSADVDRRVAHRVAVAVQVMLAKELPRPGEDSAASVQGPALPPEQYSLPLDSHNITEAEREVNAEAALGYRVVGADLTGKHTALLTFEKPAVSTSIYEYRIFHIMLEGTMKKELRDASRDGFCVVPHTLMPGFGGFVSWVMERPSGIHAARCEYREHAPVRVSTTEHQMEDDKKDGFHLVDATEIVGSHIVLMERFLSPDAHP